MNTAQRTLQKILLAALVASPVIAAAPALAAPPIPVVRLEPMVIVGHRAAPVVTNMATAAPASAVLQTMVIVGHRAAAEATSVAAAPANAVLETMVIVGHRGVSQPTNELASVRLPVAAAHRIAL